MSSLRTKFVLLADRPDALPTIAKGWFEEWGHERLGSSLDGLIDEIQLKV
jgi:hypothetical protein